MLDIQHLYDKFYGKLPDSTLEFSATINALYPQIYDARQIKLANKPILDVISSGPGYSLTACYKRVIKEDFKFG